MHNNPVNAIDPTGMFSITETITSMAISYALAEIYTPVLDHLSGGLISSLVSEEVWNKIIFLSPDAISLGISASGGWGKGLGGSLLGGMEFLISPHNLNFAAYTYAGGRFDIGSKGWNGSLGISAGLVFNCKNSKNYREGFMTLSLPLKMVPKKVRKTLRDKFIQKKSFSANLMSQLGMGPNSWSSFKVQSAGLWSLEQALNSWNTIDRDMKNLNASINISWSIPTIEVVSVAFAGSFDVGKTASYSFSGTYYSQTIPKNNIDVPFH